MCGRFTLALTVGLGERFGVDDTGLSLSPRFNIAPSQQVPIIYATHTGERVIRMMTWGLVPSWTRDLTGARPIINARADTLSERPSFHGPLARHRCLVPATGFYEWQKSGTQKVPVYIRRKDQALFAFAGLFDILKGRDPPLWTFTIITTEPNALVARFHDRMPAILQPRDEARWIAPGPIGEGERKAILSPCPDDILEAYPVSKAVNDPQQDGPHLIQRSGDRTLDL
ncbi:MAG TPA: SOS response-associated peptidase [Methanolinea sp.]|jgi:putative SOS response-associated peptidase YedK|nr:SOS response-associated peptidase [Methanolinea sp.]HOS81146.1 SOS response-associated peptidase [Methanolinea sp.]HPC54790.1 SOS response-associated peptidase [Methanolinea sp.]HQE84903.1 SOS response-associated peptidase [Methanolinea sp.]HQI13857.1 SOS response-associated peptidase [Methanolinea sp.]